MNLEAVLILSLTSIFAISFAFGHPEKGKWTFEATAPYPKTVMVTKSMYANSTIEVKITCSIERDISAIWYLQKMQCWRNQIELMLYDTSAVKIMNNLPSQNETSKPVPLSDKLHLHCDESGTYLEYHGPLLAPNTTPDTEQAVAGKPDVTTVKSKKDETAKSNKVLHSMPADGIYIFVLEVAPDVNAKSNVSIFIKIDMKDSYGYLSAADYPLLPFYGIMCFVYFCYGVGWLSVSFMRWRELLRVQYWIGAVIFLGMLEKAFFTGVYETVNERGEFSPPLLYLAEIVSCVKRTLSRLLVIIVAFGFGIVKPRLGNVLQRVVVLGLLYFILATVESCFRVAKLNNSMSAIGDKEIFALLPLILLETVICWWVFSALVSTIRTLSLRRNTVKLQLYRHFKNTLAFAVGVSVIFMTYCILNQNTCIEDWKQLWVNTAFWHVLFAFILLVIMILWRPTNNNQRFAFSPLLDEASEDEEEKLVAADVSDSMTLRSTRINSTSNSKDSRDLEEDLQWLDENIPKTMLDKGFPSVDSDEEVIVTKFEISKMQ